MHGRTALVVDDDDDIRALVTTVLARAGYGIDAVDAGAPALESAQADPPAVYVLDVRMPGMDGHEVCRRLKADPRTNGPVLMVSAEASAQDIAAGLEAGADDFLPKPFSPRELLARLDVLLGDDVAA